jgi:RNA polymerase sigma factor (sigma-70 family)
VFNKEVVSHNKELEYIQRAALGDHDAFRHLVLAYEASVLAYLQSMVGDWENARDITQETFIAAFYALPHWQPPEILNQSQPLSQKGKLSSRSTMDHPLAPWLYRIATNHALTFLKQQSRHKRMVPFHSETLADTGHVAEAIMKPRGSVEAWEDRYVMRELLLEALKQLSEDDAVCIVLRFIVGERYAEIAEQLGTTKEAVRKRVTRGLVVLRSVYKALDLETN